MVSANYKPIPREPENFPRALRVLSAWRIAKGYSRAGKELALRVTGPFPSFETLCRDYSGDIPYRVILTELERRKRVKLKRKRMWISITKSADSRIAHHRELSNLVFAASIVSALSKSEGILVKRQDKVRASNAIQDSYVENSIASRVTGLLDNLPQLFVSRGKSRQSKNRVTIFTLVSRARTNSKTPELKMASKKQQAEYFGGAMTALCELMSTFGISRETTEMQFRVALERGYARGVIPPSIEGRPITRMADLCRRWYFEKAYLDKMESLAS